MCIRLAALQALCKQRNSDDGGQLCDAIEFGAPYHNTRENVNLRSSAADYGGAENRVPDSTHCQALIQSQATSSPPSTNAQ